MPGHFYDFSIHSYWRKRTQELLFLFSLFFQLYFVSFQRRTVAIESSDLKLTLADLEILQLGTLKLEIFKLQIEDSKYRKYRTTLFSLLDRDLWKYKWKVRGLVKVKALKSECTVENGISRLNHPSESFLHIFKGAALSR